MKCATKQRHTRSSKPIPIGLHHTVCGSEALNLAKRLNEELATQQAAQGGSLGNHDRPGHGDRESHEPRSRSFEQGEKSKGMIDRLFNQIFYLAILCMGVDSILKKNWYLRSLTACFQDENLFF